MHFPSIFALFITLPAALAAPLVDATPPARQLPLRIPAAFSPPPDSHPPPYPAQIISSPRDEKVEREGGGDQSSLKSKFPTVHDSAVLARRLLALSPLGTLSTTFPHHLPSPRIPSTVSNLPIGLPDYISACGTGSHASDPTLLAVNVATSFQNALRGDHHNASLSIQWDPPHDHHHGGQKCIAANLPRMALMGYLEPITFSGEDGNGESEGEKHLETCFTKTHPDARWWLPSNPDSPHATQWVRFVVTELYWIGGFGDRNYIGWIPEETWRNVTEEEWKKARLRGE